MSAECHRCGTDLVYPDGSWPVGECPVCEPRHSDEAVDRAARVLYERLRVDMQLKGDFDGLTDDDREAWLADVRAVAAALQDFQPHQGGSTTPEEGTR